MPSTDPSHRAVKRARTLIELLMKEMHSALRHPDRLTPEQWDKLFGAKQSMISNLQKLVAALMALPGTEENVPDPHEPVSGREIELLSAWLEESKGG